MTYDIIKQPFEKDLLDMSKGELEQYFQWFIGVIPARIDVLEEAVRNTPGFGQWCADYTPSSLSPLGHWFASQVETRSRSETELEKIREKQTFPMDVPETELTTRTLSLVMDIGMYLGRVFLTNHPSLKWSQDTSDKKFAYYGQPLVTGFGSVPFNPAGTALVQAYGLISKKKTGDRLREIYDIWQKRTGPSS
ncbi:MAG TPA: hypothetical protein VGN46_05850 [Luteibacter sp.]|jgi:hypothetical protein|uniref:hypothetical protein n=1 Tax=Luteibacter sp. TaxID=1886636 RepID=UPI002F4249D9